MGDTGEADGRPLPLVTVGMPVYNGAAHLEEALQSVLAQDYPALEVLVCDNASDDATPAIATEFAAHDPRVRYLRNAENIGLLPNFRRVRDLARGEYFTWLGHDDLISDPAYLSTTAGYLTRHPEVGLCHTEVQLLRPDGTSSVVRFPELHPDRPWDQARRDLFDWPQEWLEMCSHGVFRRSLLAQLPMPESTNTGRPAVFCWEIGVLTEVACRSRVVVLPQPMRTYRSSAASAARLIGRGVSPFDLWLLDLETKAALLRRAVRAPGPPLERLRLAGVAIANFPKPTFRRRFDHRYATRLAERRLAMLLRTAHERRRLLERLQDEISARRRILEERGVGAPTAGEQREPGSGAVAGRAVEVLAADPSPPPLKAFFRPPAPEVVARYTEIDVRSRELVAYCEKLLGAVEDADREAGALLSFIEAG
ncbi:MAG TPA: glycosyltransferase family A protein [Actinomycetota bacterium]|nr:glycosyltransferase family A protein [Actinomycetota bacterium]